MKQTTTKSRLKAAPATAAAVAVAVAAAALVCAALSASCAGKAAEAGTVRIVLDWTPNTNHTGIYAAADRGYFAEEGLTAEILMPPEDGALVLVGSGAAEFGVDFQETMGPAIARPDALPVKAVAAIISHNTSGLMSLKSAGIRRPRDMEGKRFAFWETPFYREVIRDIVENDGGRFGNVTLVPNYATDAFSALETDIDSIWIYYAWDGVAAEMRGTAIDYLDLGTLNPALDFYTPVVVVNTNWAAAHPETARQFVKALSRGYDFAAAHPEEAAAILLTYVPELDGELVRRSQNYLAGRYKDGANQWGWIDAGRWGGFYRWMYERGLLETGVGEGGFTNEYLPRAER